MSYLTLNDVRSEALFVSALQPSDQPTVEQVRAEITDMVRRFGARGCAARMAQVCGDAPDLAIPRMRWARRVVADAFARQPARTSARPLVDAGRRAA